MIVSNILANRIVGDSRIGHYKRLWAPLIIALEAFLWTGSALISAIFAVGFALWRYDGWGEQFLATHGDINAYNNRNKSKIITKIADFLMTPASVIERKVYGIIWGSFRGLYDVPLFIVLSILLNSYIVFLGLLMGLQGALYYLTAKYWGEGTDKSEVVMGAFRGILLLMALYV